MNNCKAKAFSIVERVYSSFISEVLENYVIKDRDGELGEKEKRPVESKTHIDRRVLKLMAISGKGGYSDDPEKNKKYQEFRNVTLLDHLLSVVRGSIVFYALNSVEQNNEIDEAFLVRRLKVIAAIAFLHDVDKYWQLTRNSLIGTKDLEILAEKFGIGEFLKKCGVELAASQMRYLIEKVEAWQSHRNPPETLPPREYESFPFYIRLADQLDSLWLWSDPEKGGIKGVLNTIRADKNCHQSSFLENWNEISIFDPHHPFLLDDLQRFISFYSIQITGVPPLIEIHHDGHLLMLIPEEKSEEIKEKALSRLCSSLPFSLELDVSNRGIPSLYNGEPDHFQLDEFVTGLSALKISELFKIKNELMLSLGSNITEMLYETGVVPKWPAKAAGALVSIYSSLQNIDESEKNWLKKAAHLVLLLNLKVDAKPKDNIPTYEKREKAIIEALAEKRPGWIENIKDEASRRIITGLWVTVISFNDADVTDRIWGDNGLLQMWIEGDKNNPGFKHFIRGEGGEVIDAVRRRFSSLLNNQFVNAENDTAKGRCLFTDEPVDFDKTINEALGLYGVKITAFSGRDGRPESVTSADRHTNVSPVSIAEHKKRSGIHDGKGDGVPILISSPSTMGLFGSLCLKSDKETGNISLYDMTRLEVKKGRVISGFEMYQGRHRLARLEKFPVALKDQIDFLRMLLTASRRIGRPFHIFKGLPTQENSFFYFDSIPETVSLLIGGKSLRLEQIPVAIKNLELASAIAEEPGLGHDALKMYAMPETRFSSICLICSHLKSKDKSNSNLYKILVEEFLIHIKGAERMSENDKALVKLGRAAAGIQKNPGGQASASEELLVFKICMDTANQLRKVNQADEESIVLGIAGELETNLVRKDKAASRARRENKSLIEGCMATADLFVKEVWQGVLKGKSPSQKSMRVFSSIYRMSFLMAHRDAAAKSETIDKTSDN